MRTTRASFHALKDALLALVDNAGGYDQSLVGSASIRLRNIGEAEMADGLNEADRNGRRVLRAIQDGEL